MLGAGGADHICQHPAVGIHNNRLGHCGADIDAGEIKARGQIVDARTMLPYPSVSRNASTLVLMGASDLSL
jgi:hypothetical protein